ncbi:hypothetical protein [Pseudomonas alvandae]|uniref:Uncharacterized protein n=1 Tax=Pseudomonas canavaninivorans TaxID=2842348 RepID=A0ABX8QKC4_PSECO|nr:hypothetical protein [Pseudomonas alvandae]QXI55791.1 hypothetical protein KSS97_12925 [Pseudomonas alvandae]
MDEIAQVEVVGSVVPAQLDRSFPAIRIDMNDGEVRSQLDFEIGLHAGFRANQAAHG